MNIQEFCDQNWFKLKQSIDWDWDRYNDGIPSVTTILWLIVDPWFEYVKRNYKEALSKACERWTRIHNEAEDFALGKSKTQHKQITKFQVLYDVTIESTETKYRKSIFVHWEECTIQWTIDVVWKLWIIPTNADYKSSMNTSLKYLLQLWGYEFLNDRPWVLVHLSDKEFKVISSEYFYKELFLELSHYFFTLLEHGKQN